MCANVGRPLGVRAVVSLAWCVNGASAETLVRRYPDPLPLLIRMQCQPSLTREIDLRERPLRISGSRYRDFALSLVPLVPSVL